MRDAAKIEMLQNEIEDLKKQLQVKTKEDLKVRAIQGLGGVIHSIELRHLCVLAALQTMKAHPPESDARLTMIAETALHLGLAVYDQIVMNDSMDEFQEFDPEEWTGEDKTI